MVAELFASPLKIYSPVPRMTGEIIFSMENGSIYTFHPQEEAPAKIVTHGGHASGIAMDARATTKLFLADMAHQAILSPEIRDPSSGEGTVTEELVQGFDGEPFLGPHSIVLSKNGEKLYFSDSGPWGETSIQNPKGSIYCIECDPKNIAPLAYNCLAYPSGITLSNDEKFLYVCETGRNRLLRFILKEECPFRFTVFFQFNGRYGPTAITTHAESGNLYVALFEFKGRFGRSYPRVRPKR